jgi:hypothetical protein
MRPRHPFDIRKGLSPLMARWLIPNDPVDEVGAAKTHGILAYDRLGLSESTQEGSLPSYRNSCPKLSR